MNEGTKGLILQTLVNIKNVEEKYRQILENPALFVSENGGFSTQDHDILEKIISLSNEMNIAADVITPKRLGL